MTERHFPRSYYIISIIYLVSNHHHHQPINAPTARAQAISMDYWGARWSSGQCARRAIAEAKHRSQRPVLGWVTKIYYLELLRALEGTLSRWSRLHLQSLAQFQGGLTSGRRPVVKIIAESLSQHDEKHVVPTSLNGIRVGGRILRRTDHHPPRRPKQGHRGNDGLTATVSSQLSSFGTTRAYRKNISDVSATPLGIKREWCVCLHIIK
jgi:hypothetical protein